ncbi:MAG: glutamate-5-semialdehyde dehydrogenase [Verrucomicrobiota bacterium]|nr:glutamate-5-semialdehyde dehydrogenase [Verrucomicrobiota bacterium]
MIDKVSMKKTLLEMGRKARSASKELKTMRSVQKNKILSSIATRLVEEKDYILSQNKIDLKNGRENGLSNAMLDRLELTEDRISNIAKGLHEISGLQDAVAKVDSTYIRPNGLEIKKIRVPIGVIGIIYESRPNVTVDAAGLCLKSGNAVFLRGGSESIHSNMAFAKVMQESGLEAGLPEAAVQLIPWTDREAINIMLRMDEFIDLLIPRGGEGLIRKVVETSTIPVIKHYKGVCHIYVDSEFNKEMALNIIENSKCQRPGVCNALETLLVHKDIAEDFLPALEQLLAERHVQLRCGKKARQILPSAESATEEDWKKEYLDLILSVKVVDSVKDAVEHISTYGSDHSDCIITENDKNANFFLRAVDSAAVYVNASTRFTDGAMFGMGAEIGISTDRIHARGPMGLEELTTYKYVIYGKGQIR